MNANMTGLNTRLKKGALAATIAVLVALWTIPVHAQVVSTPRPGPPGSWRLI